MQWCTGPHIERSTTTLDQILGYGYMPKMLRLPYNIAVFVKSKFTLLKHCSIMYLVCRQDLPLLLRIICSRQQSDQLVLQSRPQNKLSYYLLVDDLSSGGKPEWACIADLIFYHGTQTMETAGFATVCCSMNTVSGKQNFVQPFLRLKKLLQLHTQTWQWSNELNLWRLWVSLWMALTWSELYCVGFDNTTCDQPTLVCHGLQSHSVDPSVWS